MLKTKFQFHPIPQNCHFPEIYFPIQLIFFSFKIHKNLIHPSTRVANPPRTHTITRASRTRIVFSSHESAHIFTPFFGWFCCGACVCVHFFSLACFTSLLLSPSDEPNRPIRAHTHTHSLVRQVDDYFVFFFVVAFAFFLAPFENGFCFHLLGGLRVSELRVYGWG